MKPTDKLELEKVVSTNPNITEPLGYFYSIEKMGEKFNQLISSHNELIKIINKLKE